MTVLSYTTQFRFRKIDFDSVPWHDDEHANWNYLDQLLGLYLPITGIVGIWTVSTSYAVGNRVIDNDDATLWQCDVAHTSASSGSFVADRTINPTYWSAIAGVSTAWADITSKPTSISGFGITDAYTKTQVDSFFTTNTAAIALKLDKAGGTMTGALTLSGAPTSNLHAATKQYVDGLAAGIGKNALVRAATTANITIATALNNGDTLDGVVLATNDLVLVKNQTAPAENGIYVVDTVPARHGDFDTYNEHVGALIGVSEGTANEGTTYICLANSGGVLDTTAIDFNPLSIAAPDLLPYALLADNNVFTDVQTVHVSDSATNTSSEALRLKHNTSGTATASFGISMVFELENAAPADKDAASIDVDWVTATAASEDSRIKFLTMIAGAAKAVVGYIAKGLVLGSASGGDKGVGTLNATALYQNGIFALPTTIKKVANQSVASTTLTNDSDFTFPLAANTKYLVEMYLAATHTGTEDFKFDITGPASPNAVTISAHASGINDGGGSQNLLTSAPVDAFSTTMTVLSGTTGMSMDLIRITAYINNGANAGTFQFRWANNATATSRSLLARSWMSYQPVN